MQTDKKNSVVIEAKDLSKVYRIWSDPAARLKYPLLRTAASLLPEKLRPRQFSATLSQTKYYRDFYALRDLSLTIRRGEAVGIIGRNGSGKSTLLQMIAGTLTPTTGSVNTYGRIAALLELGSGFNPEFTGRENVYLNAAVLGLSKAQIDQRYEAIAAFAEIGDFIDQPVRTYSSGMVVRLAFAVAAHVEPDILIVDEALSAGDAQFSSKAAGKMKEISSQGEILILVTHAMASAVAMCDRCLWMEQGRIIMDGPSAKVTEAYREHLREYEEKRIRERFQNIMRRQSVDSRLRIDRFELRDSRGDSRMIFESGEPVLFHLCVHAVGRIERPDVRLSVRRLDGITILQNLASRDGLSLGPMEGEAVVEASLGELALGEQSYEVLAEFLDRDRPPELALLAAGSTVMKVERHGDISDRPAYVSPILHASRLKDLPTEGNGIT